MFKAGSLTDLELAKKARLLSQQDPGIHLSPPPKHWDHKYGLSFSEAQPSPMISLIYLFFLYLFKFIVMVCMHLLCGQRITLWN